MIKQLVGESNRMFANMLDIFSLISGIDVSYKTIERLYSDDEVITAIHNLHVLMLKKKGVKNSDATGDGTGYGLTVKKNYESYAQKLKELAKENPEKGDEKKDETKKAKEHKKRLFAYSFTTMDRKFHPSFHRKLSYSPVLDVRSRVVNTTLTYSRIYETFIG